MKGLSVTTVLKKLDAIYDPPKTFLDYRTPLDLVVVTILSAQCTDARVNIVSKSLYKKYKKPEDYLKVSQQELETDIHSCGTFRNKARFIKSLSKMIIEDYDGKVPDTMEELIKLPGIGRKTASIILYAIYGKQEGIAVDTHVMRLSQRLGLSKHSTPQKIELDLIKETPRKKWGELNTLMISHGRAVCTARDRKCEICVFKKECPSSFVMGRKDLAKKKKIV